MTLLGVLSAGAGLQVLFYRTGLIVMNVYTVLEGC